MYVHDCMKIDIHESMYVWMDESRHECICVCACIQIQTNIHVIPGHVSFKQGKPK